MFFFEHEEGSTEDLETFCGVGQVFLPERLKSAGAFHSTTQLTHQVTFRYALHCFTRCRHLYLHLYRRGDPPGDAYAASPL